ncbi:hypothetical protein O3P69_012372 [Scylla paramamosain]|uniref:Uncharacterized protein n=1 Tax=Scylla paramamosain TaxID=85552 RepID=A0AAW0SFP5_SCYPA
MWNQRLPARGSKLRRRDSSGGSSERRLRQLHGAALMLVTVVGIPAHSQQASAASFRLVTAYTLNRTDDSTQTFLRVGTSPSTRSLTLALQTDLTNCGCNVTGNYSGRVLQVTGGYTGDALKIVAQRYQHVGGVGSAEELVSVAWHPEEERDAAGTEAGRGVVVRTQFSESIFGVSLDSLMPGKRRRLLNLTVTPHTGEHWQVSLHVPIISTALEWETKLWKNQGKQHWEVNGEVKSTKSDISLEFVHFKQEKQDEETQVTDDRGEAGRCDAEGCGDGNVKEPKAKSRHHVDSDCDSDLRKEQTVDQNEVCSGRDHKSEDLKQNDHDSVMLNVDEECSRKAECDGPEESVSSEAVQETTQKLTSRVFSLSSNMKTFVSSDGGRWIRILQRTHLVFCPHVGWNLNRQVVVVDTRPAGQVVAVDTRPAGQVMVMAVDTRPAGLVVAVDTPPAGQVMVMAVDTRPAGQVVAVDTRPAGQVVAVDTRPAGQVMVMAVDTRPAGQVVAVDTRPAGQVMVMAVDTRPAGQVVAVDTRSTRQVIVIAVDTRPAEQMVAVNTRPAGQAVAVDTRSAGQWWR